jgi:DNA invertase Pin-like site-specific DNA recombinase
MCGARAVLYLRVSTIDQTTANQERELREVASGMGCEIVRVYKDHGISGARRGIGGLSLIGSSGMPLSASSTW